MSEIVLISYPRMSLAATFFDDPQELEYETFMKWVAEQGIQTKDTTIYHGSEQSNRIVAAGTIKVCRRMAD